LSFVPGKVKGVDLKKTLAHIVASALIPLTLAFVACGDEKTSSVIEVDSVSPKTVLANSGPCSLNYTNGGDLAYLTNNEKVGYQIIIPDVSAIGYYTDSELKAERIGDTLEVMYPSETIVKLAWICYVYYTFNIPAEDADVKYLKYIDYVYKVVPGPAPEKVPDTSCVYFPHEPYEEGVYDSTFCFVCSFNPSAEGVYDTSCTFFPYDLYQSSSFDSIVGSSSSNSAKSSSSSAAKVTGRKQAKDIKLECMNKEQNEAFSNTNYLVFGMREPMPLKNGVVVDASVLEN
jgi:hypothetical protein